MAKQRVVNTKFWDDGYISSLDPIGKLVFLYVLTNPLTDLCGAYEITMKRIANDTGLKPARLTAILKHFEESGKIIYRNGWMIVRNFAKHQVSNPKVSKGIERSLKDCPDWIKETLIIGYDSLSKPIALLPVGTTCRDNPDLTEQPEPKPTERKPSPLPLDFSITPEMRTWANTKVPGLDIDDEFEEFCGFWWNIDGGKTKRSEAGWVQTWQGRMRDVHKRAPRTRQEPKAANGYDPKKDIMHRDYEMPPARNDFASAVETYFNIHDDGTREKYEQMKKNWLTGKSAKGFEYEIEEYERGYKFRERFSETGPDSVGASADAGRG